MPDTEQLLYQTEKNSHWRFSIKTLFLKILQYLRENTHKKFLRIPILKNFAALSAYGCFWTDFTKYCLKLSFRIAFKTISTQ